MALETVAELKTTCEEQLVETPGALGNERLIQEARAKELKWMLTLPAFAVVPRSTATTRIMTTRWVDVDKGDRWRSRITCRGYEQRVDPATDFYAHTPSIAALRLLLVVAWRRGFAVAAGDCKSAFLQAPCSGDVFVELVPEAKVDPKSCWKCLRNLPGLKGGPADWAKHIQNLLVELGLLGIESFLQSDLVLLDTIFSSCEITLLGSIRIILDHCLLE